MKINVKIPLILGMLLALLAGQAWGATYYVDNELVAGANDGSSWADAFQSTTALLNVLSAGDNTIYFKATSTPYRTGFTDYKYNGATMIFDATGIGTNRGSTRAKVYGSTQYTNLTWTLAGGTVYRTNGIANTLIRGTTIPNTKLGLWVVDSSGNIVTELTNGRNASHTAATIVSGEYYAQSTNTYTYINLGGTNPNGLIFEASTVNHLFEVQDVATGLTLYGVDARYALYGHYNGGCDPVRIYDSEFSRMGWHGVQLVIDNEVGEETESIIQNVVSHHNGYDGFFILYTLDYVNGMRAYLTTQYCVSHSNRRDGFRIEGFPASNAHYAKIYNCTIYGNLGLGINFADALVSGNATYLKVVNTISHGNTGDEFYIQDSADFNLIASNNCNGGGSYGGKWEANKGSGNVESDPLFVSSTDFRLQTLSPAIDGGTAITGLQTGSTIVGGDAAGNTRLYGTGVDIGAYERKKFKQKFWDNKSASDGFTDDYIRKLYTVP